MTDGHRHADTLRRDATTLEKDHPDCAGIVQNMRDAAKAIEGVAPDPGPGPGATPVRRARPAAEADETA